MTTDSKRVQSALVRDDNAVLVACCDCRAIAVTKGVDEARLHDGISSEQWVTELALVFKQILTPSKRVHGTLRQQKRV